MIHHSIINSPNATKRSASGMAFEFEEPVLRENVASELFGREVRFCFREDDCAESVDDRVNLRPGGGVRDLDWMWVVRAEGFIDPDRFVDCLIVRMPFSSRSPPPLLDAAIASRRKSSNASNSAVSKARLDTLSPPP